MRLCTEQEFMDTITKQYPAKYFNSDYEPSSGFRTLFALDTFGECQLSYDSKEKLSEYVWSCGRVIKESGSLFINFPDTNSNPASVNIFAPHPFSIGWVKELEETTKQFELNLKGCDELKCVCGAHKTGSNRHSSWCDIKENA